MGAFALVLTVLLATGPAREDTLEALVKQVHPAFNPASRMLDDHFHLAASDVTRDAQGNQWAALVISARKDGRYAATDLLVEIVRFPPKSGPVLSVTRGTEVAGVRSDVDERDKLVVTWRPVQIAPKESALALAIEGGNRLIGEWFREVTWYATDDARPLLRYVEYSEDAAQCGERESRVEVTRLKKLTQGHYDIRLTTISQRETGLCGGTRSHIDTDRQAETLQWGGSVYGFDARAPAQFPIVEAITASASPLIDGRDVTAWTPGKDGPQPVDIRLMGVLPVQALIVTNGCPPDAQQRGRARTLEVMFDDDSTALLELKDTAAPQVVMLPQIVRTRSLRLEVREGYKGSLDETCLSEIRVELQP